MALCWLEVQFIEGWPVAEEMASSWRAQISEAALIVLKHLESSAYIAKDEVFRMSGISLTNNRNSIGPRIEPCGTPDLTKLQDEKGHVDFSHKVALEPVQQRTIDTKHAKLWQKFCMAHRVKSLWDKTALFLRCPRSPVPWKMHLHLRCLPVLSTTDLAVAIIPNNRRTK